MVQETTLPPLYPYMSNQHNNRRERALQKLAARFEANSLKGQEIFLSEEEYEDLLSYYFGMEDFDRALSVADQASGQYRFTPEFYKWKALLHKINAHEEAALAALDQLSIYAPADYESLVLRLEILVHFDHRDDARATLDQLTPMAEYPDQRSGLIFYDGVLLLFDGQIKEAYTAFTEAIRLDPWQEASLAELLDNEAFNKYRPRLAGLLAELTNENPFNDLIWFYLGLVRNEIGEDIGALEAYGYALALNDSRPDYLLEYADKLFDLERFEQALSIYQRYLKLPEAEQSYETNMRMGRSYQLLERYEEAKNCFLLALEVEPGMYDIYQHLAECCVAENKWGMATHYYERAVGCENTSADCWLGLACCSVTTNEPQRAEEAFLKALKMQPTRSDAHVTYALFLVEQGREREALSVIENARDNYYDAALAYGAVAVNLVSNRRREALTFLSEALSTFYDEHVYLLEWCPELMDDSEIVAMLQLYK